MRAPGYPHFVQLCLRGKLKGGTSMGPHTRGVSGASSLGRLQPSLVGLEADGLAYVTCSVALTFILTFQTNLKLLVHPWQMSQRVHADTEHRRGENLKRKENNRKEKQNNKQKTKHKSGITHHPCPHFHPQPTPSVVVAVGEQQAPTLRSSTCLLPGNGAWPGEAGVIF